MQEFGDLRFSSPNQQRFGVRATGFLFNQNKQVLVAPKGDYTGSIGGAVKFGETTEMAVTREYLEEAGIKVEIVRLLGVIEQLFKNDAGQNYQQIIFVYLLKSAKPVISKKIATDFDQRKLVFTDIDHVTNLLPQSLFQLLKDLPMQTQHFIENRL